MTEDVKARCLLDVLPDLVILTEADGTITWVSAGGPPSLGWEPSSLVGTTVFDLFAVAADRPVHLGALAGILSLPGVHGPIEVTVVAADGRLREMEIMVTNALADPDVGRLVAECRDITGRDWELEHIRQSEAWSSSLLRNTSDLLIVCDRMGGVAYVTPSVERVLGFAPDQVGSQSLYSMVHPDDLRMEPDSGQTVDRVIGTGPGLRPVLRFRHAAGGWRRLRVERTVNLGDPGSERSVLLTCRDITRDEMSEVLLTDQAIVLEQIARGAPVGDSLVAIEQLATRRLSDGRVCIAYVDPDHGTVWEAPGFDPALLAALIEAGLGAMPTAPSPAGVSFRRDDEWDSLVRRGSGQQFCAAWFTDLVGAEGKVIGRLCVLREHDLPLNAEELDLLGRASDLASIAVERHDLQVRLAHGAMHDDLTRLPNRRYLLSKLRDLFGGAGARGGLLFVDLDRFKLINDSLGHDAGDQLLQEVTRRFVRTVRSVDIVARVGGDEFVVVCPELDDADAITHLASRLTSVLKEPISLNGGRVEISASIGVVHVAGPARAGDILQDADLAMYEAKKQGRDGIAVFHEGLRDRARARMEMEQALREARRRDEMQLYFQPVVRLRDGQMMGVEALLRWNRPGFGLMLPDDFVPIATDTGMILPLGRWVIEEAAAAAARWPLLEVAANLSARQLTDVDLVDFVAEVLKRNGVAPERFCLEITEADLSTDIDLMSDQLARLGALGVRLAIDDFGTGFATLDYLRRFSAAHVLKVDASFVAGLGDPALPDVAIVSAALVLAEKLNFDTVAEGVETEEQRRVLLELGCQRAQGYLFSPPVTAAEIDDLVAAAADPLP